MMPDSFAKKLREDVRSSPPPLKCVLFLVHPMLCAKCQPGRGNFALSPSWRPRRLRNGRCPVLRAGRQGAPEAADRVALSWPGRGVRKGVPSRLGEALRPAPRPPAARRRAVSAAPTARRWNSPRPASSATRREPRQPLAHLLGAWPPAKALLDWRRGDKGGGVYRGPAPRLKYLRELVASLGSQRSGSASRGRVLTTPARPGDPGLLRPPCRALSSSGSLPAPAGGPTTASCTTLLQVSERRPRWGGFGGRFRGADLGERTRGHERVKGVGAGTCEARGMRSPRQVDPGGWGRAFRGRRSGFEGRS